ncbi:hypothetical protein ABT160_33230 [Streptomyces sp. NPDC001941]|uniref:hypothetical protein n=1 Tax=Streptomyces sp. NPDC001941 TaxID=3154659 RepID=UPI00332C6350
MLVWRRIATGVRPVPSPAAAPLTWTAAAVGAAAFMGLLYALDAGDETGFALAVLSLLAALLGLRGRFTAAPGTALLCWMFLNVFGTAPTGELSWAGHRDPEWMACLLGAALLGTVTGRIAHARAAYRRVTPYDGR